jgi:outer membrane protein OmpA-like peptidoglycan-associated protein
MFKLNKATDYMVSAEKDQYLGSTDEAQSTVGLEFSTDLTQDLVLSRNGFDLKDIYYDLDSDSLRPESIVKLDTLIEIMKNYPKLIIELGSHTDCRASAEYNQDLSQRRAQSVINYLVNQKGIPAGRMEAKGYGESQLVNNCQCDKKDNDTGIHCTEEEHQANRRTTVRVLSFNYKP